MFLFHYYILHIYFNSLLTESPPHMLLLNQKNYFLYFPANCMLHKALSNSALKFGLRRYIRHT